MISAARWNAVLSGSIRGCIGEIAAPSRKGRATRVPAEAANCRSDEVTEPGPTAVICQPHVGVGMAALIVAGGDTSNADAVLDARIRGRSEGKIEELIEQAREDA